MRISAKDLGWLAVDDFCSRCFWIERHAKGLPYQVGFPGIFSSIDAYTKNIVDHLSSKFKVLVVNVPDDMTTEWKAKTSNLKCAYCGKSIRKGAVVVGVVGQAVLHKKCASN